MSKVVYALHPGIVTSANDGRQHYIGEDRLARLYGLKRGEYIVWNEYIIQGYRESYIHLYPQYDGKYDLPKASSDQ